jgi:hypothetical protein
MGGEYEVEKILERRQRGRTEEFKVKWKGYGLDECTWEPEANLSSCRELLEEFKNKQRNLSNSKTGKPIQKQTAVKTYKPKEPEKPKMKGKAINDDEDDIYREDDDEDEIETRSARKLKRPGQQLSSINSQPRKGIRTGKGPNGVASNKLAEASEEEEELDELFPEDIPSEGNKLGDTTKPNQNGGIEILAMFHNDKNEYCYKVREKGTESVITREKLLGKNPVALVLFYESKIKIGVK